MNQKGFAPIIIILVVVALAILGGVFTYSSYTKSHTEKNSNKSKTTTSITTASNSASLSPSSTPKTNTTSKNSTSLKSSNTAISGSCDIVLVSVSEDNPLTVKLAYNFTPSNNQYMTGAQWDFDGNGSWDTDMNQSNGTINHNYPKAGPYNTKLQLKLSDGKMTPVCTKTITVYNGISVSFTGTVFRDDNCNDTREPDEPGIANMPIRFNKLDYSTYKTLTGGGSGEYNLTVRIKDNDSLTIQPTPDLNKYSNITDPSVVAYSPYKIHYDVPFATLNSSQRTVSRDVPLVPSENSGKCTN